MCILHNYFRLQIVFVFQCSKGIRRIVVMTLCMNKKEKKKKLKNTFPYTIFKIMIKRK